MGGRRGVGVGGGWGGGEEPSRSSVAGHRYVLEV